MNNQTYTEFLNNHQELVNKNTKYIKILDFVISQVEKVRIEVKRINKYE